MTIRAVSIDVGNRLAKGVRGGGVQPTVFPNVIASDQNHQALKGFEGFGVKDPLIVEAEGVRYAVGYAAQDLSKRTRSHVGYTRYDEPEFKPLVAGLLADMYPNKSGTLAVTFSLPVDGFGMAAAVTGQLAGRWEFVCRGQSLWFELPYEYLFPVPEAFGSICFFLLNREGTAYNKDYKHLANDRVAVIDVGGFTTDVLTFDRLQITPVYGSSERGVIQVRKQVNEAIKRDFGRSSLDDKTLDRVLDTGIYTHRGKPERVTELIEEAIFELSEDVLNIWTDPDGLNSGLDYDTVIFTGGGSPLIAPYLVKGMKTRGVEHYNMKFVPVEVAHLANALGAFRFAARRRALLQ